MLLLFDVLILTVPLGIKGKKLVPVCGFLKVCDIKSLSTFLLTICRFFLEDMSITNLHYFLVGL